MRDVGEIAVELDHVGKVGLDGRERCPEVAEYLHRLGMEIARRAHHVAIAVGAELAGDVDGAAGASHLDHLGVARRFDQRLGIDEADSGGHGDSPFNGRERVDPYPQNLLDAKSV